MGATGKRRVGMTAAVIIAALAVCIAAALAWYVGNSRHGEERDLAKAVAAGFVEKRARVEVSLAGEATGSMIEAVVNYAEGPDNGPALVLVHGQGMQWEDYAHVLPDLAQRYHVFAVDCFGHGESSHDPALYSCEDRRVLSRVGPFVGRHHRRVVGRQRRRAGIGMRVGGSALLPRHAGRDAAGTGLLRMERRLRGDARVPPVGRRCRPNRVLRAAQLPVQPVRRAAA